MSSPNRRSRSAEFLLWEPDARIDALLRADWERVFAKVRQGRAHDLSESDGAIMGPCTKGATGLSAAPSAFRRPAREASRMGSEANLHLAALSGRSSKPPAESLLDGLSAWMPPRSSRRGCSSASLPSWAGRSKTLVPNSKCRRATPRATRPPSFAASSVPRGFRARDPSSSRRWVSPRVSRESVTTSCLTRRCRSPRSGTTRYWRRPGRTAILLARVEYMLLIPVHGRTKSTPQKDCTLGVPVFWRPSAEELDLIRREWEIFRLEIREGRANRSDASSETLAIHVRPHGRDARDTDDAPASVRS